MNKKISVLIPVFNREKLISEAIESALSQNYNNYEIIVVDNSSDDSTWEVVSSYKNRYPSIVKAFRNPSNIGPVLNWAKCLSYAEGDYIKFLFSDDLLLPGCLSSMVDNMSEDVGFCVSSVLIGPSPSSNISKVFYRWSCSSKTQSSSEFLKSAWSSNVVCHSPGAALFRAEDVNRHLMEYVKDPIYADFRSTGAGSDLLLFLLTALDYKSVFYLDKPTVFFRAHSNAMTLGENAKKVQFCYTASKLFFYSRHKELLASGIGSILLFDWIRYQVRTRSALSFERYLWEVLGFKNQKIGFMQFLIVVGKLFKNMPRYLIRRV